MPAKRGKVNTIKSENNSAKKTSKQEKTKEKEVKNETAKKDEELSINDIQKMELSQIQEMVGKELQINKKVADSELRKINTKVFHNICLAITYMVYLNLIILGFINIDNGIFIVDLKVFGVSLLALAIGVFEYAYKKDSGTIAIYGIEILVLAIITIGFIYLNIMWADKFVAISTLITYIVAIYFVIKSAVIYTKMKKKYFVNEMKKIIKK